MNTSTQYIGNRSFNRLRKFKSQFVPKCVRSRKASISKKARLVTTWFGAVANKVDSVYHKGVKGVV